jgi:hypothetical protein
LHVVFDTMIQLIEQNPLLGFGLFALAHVYQHIDRTDDLSTPVAQRCRIWNNGSSGPVGTLHYDFRVADSTTFSERDRYRVLVMWQRRTIRPIKLAHCPVWSKNLSDHYGMNGKCGSARSCRAARFCCPAWVSHATDVLEHPELVAARVVRFAQVVGRENVIANTDCGLGGRVHPKIAWTKLATLSEEANWQQAALPLNAAWLSRRRKGGHYEEIAVSL